MSSIGTRLIILLTACAALIVGTGMLVDYRLSRQEILQRVVKESATEVNAVIDELETWLSGVEGATRFLGQILARQDYSREDLRAMLRDVVANNSEIYGAAIALAPAWTADGAGFAPYYFRRDGVIGYADLTSREADYRNRDWFTGPATSGTARWSEPYYDTGGGEVTMTTFSVPVFRRDAENRRALYAVVTADVRLQDLQRVLAQLHRGANSYSMLFSRGGLLMSTHSAANVMRHYSEVPGQGMDRGEWPELFRRALAGETVSATVPCPEEGGRCSLRMGQLRTTGWPLAVVYDLGDVLAPLHTFEMKTALVSAATLLLMALAVFLITSRLTRPLRELTQAAERMGRGRMDYPLPRATGNDEVARLVSAFGAMHRDLSNYIGDLAAATANRSRLEGELAAAREIQMAMLPGGGEARLDECRASLWARVEPARSVGGDFYTWHRRGHTLWFAVGDVSDKGVPAALFMARAASLLQQLADEATGPRDALTRLNDLLQRDNPACMFVTLVLGVLDTATGKLHFASAGHPAPALRRGGAVTAVAQSTGPALGLAPDQQFPANHLQLQPGDCLALCTDGVGEAFDAAGSMFGVEGFHRALAGPADAPLARTGAALFDAVAAHTGPAAQSDDIALLLLCYWPAWTAAFPAGAGVTGEVLAWMRPLLAGWGLADEVAGECLLLGEEIVTNIGKYAQIPPGGVIDLQLVRAAEFIAIEARDRGRPFDPLTQARRAALDAGIDHAEIGGLGVHLITALSQRQRYRREDGQNVLRVERALPERDTDTGTRRRPEQESGTGSDGGMKLTTTVSVDEARSVARVMLDGALNTDTAPGFEQRLEEVVDGGYRLTVLDMQDLDYISSAGLRVIFKAAKQVHADGRKLAAANRKPHIEKVFEILKALPDMAVFADEDELDDYLAHIQDQAREDGG